MITISFKSKKEFYEVEVANIKRNTVRFTNDWDDVKWDMFEKATHIRIDCLGEELNFVREIKHKCRYRNLIIISW